MNLNFVAKLSGGCVCVYSKAWCSWRTDLQAGECRAYAALCAVEAALLVAIGSVQRVSSEVRAAIQTRRLQILVQGETLNGESSAFPSPGN